MVKLPKAELEYGCLSVTFMRAKIFDDLPLEIRKQFFNKSLKSSLKSKLASNYFFLVLLTVFLLFRFSPLFFNHIFCLFLTFKIKIMKLAVCLAFYYFCLQIQDTH